MIPQATSTDYMVPEVNMNKLRIASAVAALTSALAIPAWGADATNAAKDGASNIDQPVQQGAPDAAKGAAPSDAKTTRANPPKHPPTSAMDSATPSEKTTTDKAASTKHPPTTRMDRAAPDEKSPGTASDADSTGAAGPSTQMRRN